MSQYGMVDAGGRELLSGLRAHVLTAARAAWVVIAAIVVGLIPLGIPTEFQSAKAVCPGFNDCPLPHLTPRMLQELHSLGLSADAFAAYFLVAVVLYVLVWVSVGIVVFLHNSTEPMALLGSLFLVTFGPAITYLSDLASRHPAWRPLTTPIAFVALASLFLFLYLFPQGRFSPGWSRWLALLLIVWQVPTAFFKHSALDPDTWAPAASVVAWALVFGSALAIQLYHYFRVSNAAERQQTRWVVFGISVTVVGFVGLMSLNTLAPSPDSLAGTLIGGTLYYLVQLPIPVAIGIAVLRHHLWDIDVVINRALVYGTLTASIIGLYVLIVGGLGGLLNAQGSLPFSLAATGLVAVIFQPLRMRLQRGVNRLMYGDRDEPYQVISRIGQQLERTHAPGAALPAVAEAVAHALKLPYVAIELRRDDGFLAVAVAGARSGDPLRLPLLYQGETVGQLLIGRRAGEADFSAADRRLLDDLARQAGAAVHAAQLTLALQRSREGLVTAREEERRRLRRDLHDSLGPALAAQTLKVGVARAVLRGDPDTAERLLTELEADIESSLGNVRRLVYALRPPSLDELGLTGAIREQASVYSSRGSDKDSPPLHISVDAPEELPSLPAAVEVAAYRIVQEAMTNVIRHAHARSCVVRIRLNGALELSITDDGIGLPEERRVGVGLSSIRERASELGGICVIERAPRGGTSVTASLPLHPEEA
jgi:signal transduction histidine kinase